MVDGRVIIRIDTNARQATRDMRGLDRQMVSTRNNARGMTSAMDRLSAAIPIAVVTASARRFSQLDRQLIRIETAFSSVSDSAGQATERLDFIRDEADRLGLTFTSSAEAASRLFGALDGKLPEDEIRNLTSAILEASSAMQLTEEDTFGALNAIQQIASKGVVSMEELRQQLGERIPQAFALSARAMGVTEAELNDMIASGEVLATDFLPALADEFRATFGDAAVEAAKSANGEFNRLQNNVVDITREVGNLINKALVPLARNINALFEEQDLTAGLREDLLESGERIAELEANIASIQRTGRNTLGLTIGDEGLATYERLLDQERARNNLIADTIRAETERREIAEQTTNTNRANVETEISTYQKLRDALEEATQKYADLLAQGADADRLRTAREEVESTSNAYLDVKDRIDELNKSIREGRDEQEKWELTWESFIEVAKESATSIGSSLAQSIIRPLEEGENALDRFRNLLADVVNDIAQTIARRQLVDALTGTAFGDAIGIGGAENGGIVKNNSISGFANGGVVGGFSGATTGPDDRTATVRTGEMILNASQQRELFRVANGAGGGSGPTVNVINNAGVEIETVTRPDNQVDVFVTQVNSALNNSRTDGGIRNANERLSNVGLQAV